MGYLEVSKKTYIFFGRMRSELSCKYIEDLLPNPSAFGERCEGEIVGVDFPQTCNIQTVSK